MSDDLQSPNLIEKGKNLAKFSWELINYARPCYPLANLIIEAFSKRKVNVLILQNHGLIVGAESAKEVVYKHNKIVIYYNV